MMYAKKVSGRNMSLTGGMFRFMVLSFFVSNIITVLGSMMDSFSVSNTMAGTAVLVYYYFRKDALVKPVFKGFIFREMLSANNAGLAPGLLSVWYSLTLMVKA